MKLPREKYIEERRVIRRLSRRSRFWRAVLRFLERAKRRQHVVNVYELERLKTGSGRVLVVGKLLGSGSLHRRLTVVAFDFSETAYRKVVEAGGRPIYLRDFLRESPDTSGFTIVG